jgi:hypothetical protein
VVLFIDRCGMRGLGFGYDGNAGPGGLGERRPGRGLTSLGLVSSLMILPLIDASIGSRFSFPVSANYFHG